MQSDFDVFERVGDRLASIAATVAAEDLTRATPCEAWNVGQLLDWLKQNGHVRPTSTNLFVDVQLGQKRLRELLDS